MPHKRREDRNAYQRLWRPRHPDISHRWRKRHARQSQSIQRESDAKRRFGLTYSEYIELKSGLCEVCGKRAKKMCLDHDHEKGSGSYRGVLCQQCNSRLGWFERYTEKIIAYIKKGAS